MKKIILSVALATIQITAIAQTVNVHFKNGQVIEYPSENVDYVDFSVASTPSTITAGEAVDLGLSVLWASCNLGASKPEEAGGYFSWGETKTKDYYDENSYSYFDKTSQSYINIGSNISNTEYDAAKVLLGNGWRMPTDSEIKELIDNCKWEWKDAGYVVTGKNGNAIFIPAAGYKLLNAIVGNAKDLYYWGSTLYGYSDFDAFCLFKISGVDITIYEYNRNRGLPIRPVKNKTN